MLFFLITHVAYGIRKLRYFAVRQPYVALYFAYDENKLCVSYLQPKFTKVSTECVIDYRKRKQ